MYDCQNVPIAFILDLTCRPSIHGLTTQLKNGKPCINIVYVQSEVNTISTFWQTYIGGGDIILNLTNKEKGLKRTIFSQSLFTLFKIH